MPAVPSCHTRANIPAGVTRTIRLEVRKIGNALGVLPHEVVPALHTAEGDTVHLTRTPGGHTRSRPTTSTSTSSARCARSRTSRRASATRSAPCRRDSSDLDLGARRTRHPRSAVGPRRWRGRRARRRPARIGVGASGTAPCVRRRPGRHPVDRAVLGRHLARPSVRRRQRTVAARPRPGPGRRPTPASPSGSRKEASRTPPTASRGSTVTTVPVDDVTDTAMVPAVTATERSRAPRLAIRRRIARLSTWYDSVCKPPRSASSPLS